MTYGLFLGIGLLPCGEEPYLKPAQSLRYCTSVAMY
jgi:hypothetical protein